MNHAGRGHGPTTPMPMPMPMISHAGAQAKSTRPPTLPTRGSAPDLQDAVHRILRGTCYADRGPGEPEPERPAAVNSVTASG